MMDYDKIYERIVRRGDEILEQRRKKAVKIKQTSYAVSGVCAAAIVGVGVWRITSSKNLTNNSFNENNIVSDIESTTTEALSKTTTVTTNKPVTSKGSETSKKATRITQNQTTVTTANNLDTTPSSQPVLTSKTTRNENTNATTIRTTTSVMVTQIETTTSGTVRVDSNNNNSNNNNFYAYASETWWNREASISATGATSITLSDDDNDISQYYAGSSHTSETTYTGGLNAVNVTNNTLSYNSNLTASLTSEQRKKNVTPEYTDFNVSSTHYYWYNNTLSTTQPTGTPTDIALSSYSWSTTTRSLQIASGHLCFVHGRALDPLHLPFQSHRNP